MISEKKKYNDIAYIQDERFNGTVEILAFSIGHAMVPELFEYLLSIVSAEKRARIKKYRNFADAQRVLIGDVLSRKIITENFSIKNEDIVFGYNEYGKPILQNTRNFHFNISHSGEWVACAAHSKPVGLDIERIGPIDFTIAKKFFSAEEYAALMNTDKSERLSYFFEIWTLKESYIKARGLGLSIPLNAFSCKSTEGKTVFTSENETGNYFFKQYDIEKGYKTSVCGQEESFPGDIRIVDIKDII